MQSHNETGSGSDQTKSFRAPRKDVRDSRLRSKERVTMASIDALTFFKEWLQANQEPIFRIHWSEGDLSIEVRRLGDNTYQGIVTILGEKRALTFHFENGQWITDQHMLNNSEYADR